METKSTSLSRVNSAKGQRILVVDDYEEMRFALVSLFESEGFDVVGEAANGSEAVWRAGEDQPDVIILDFRMPGLSAEQTANVLRHVAPESRIVVFSGYLEDEPKWADAYMSKDQISELPELVRRLASGTSTAT